MRYFVFLVAATLHDPTPEDIHRFAIPYMPSCSSAYQPGIARVLWRESVAGKQFILKWAVCSIDAYGRDVEGIVLEQIWRERCWWWVDELADSSKSAAWRLHAARELKTLLGPTDYYSGRLPATTGDW